MAGRRRLLKRTLAYGSGLLAALLLANGGYHQLKPMPEGSNFRGYPVPTQDVAYLVDSSWIDQDGQRQTEQTIFGEIFRIIGNARRVILLDMFLYNDFQGQPAETMRPLAEQLTSALIEQKRRFADIQIVVITDPVNELYGGLSSPYFQRLRDAGIPVVSTDLTRLRDSNPLYSSFWRLLVKPFGNSPGETLANPLGPGRVTLRSYLGLLNFKANHRKTLLADRGTEFVALVSSANPHDGSSAHRNAAIMFSGGAVADLLAAENAALRMSGFPALAIDIPRRARPGDVTVQVVTEAQIKASIIAELDQTGPADKIDLMMFYLSDRDVIDALKRAHARGAALRVLLDPNKDAFGREKNGIPNRQAAYELHGAQIDVRWCSSQGEQCHAKTLLVQHNSGSSVIIAGSANFTRRNLDNYNLETDVVVRGDSEQKVFAAAAGQFDLEWHNTASRIYSLPYERFADPSLFRRGLYRLMEWSGLSTF